MPKSRLKIKTITCHDVYNFGASLQAYALMTYLKKLGHDVEIINYKPDYLTFNLWAIGDKWSKNPLLRFAYYSYVVPKRLLMQSRRKKFDVFTRNKLQLTAQKYYSFDELKKNPPQANVFFAGSDQIWNPLLPNGKDPSFFLEFAEKGTVKASYAASFAVSDIPADLVTNTTRMLSQFNHISIRETSGMDILNKYGLEGELVVDPVFLLQKSEWKEQVPYHIEEPYIFVYDQENNRMMRDAAVFLAKKYGWKIYAIEALYPMSYADKQIKDAGPEDFLALIQSCKVCLTNSFHCISFSLIFEKSFFLFKRTHLQVNSRMVDLLTYLGIQAHIVEEIDDNLVVKEIEYTTVNERLYTRRIISYEFIEKVLNSTQSHV
ncbi:polysaccharide pyruvyl transferase family protein [Cyclobacteriaceae bacterium YHN15]|nr:polysaccharide pyruvyl transferase family protein [Cyclobacteriaceae bacterium YHN15]